METCTKYESVRHRIKTGPSKVFKLIITKFLLHMYLKIFIFTVFETYEDENKFPKRTVESIRLVLVYKPKYN